MRSKLLLINLLSFVLWLPAHAQPNNLPPNILLILSDDHSVPYLGTYGNPDLRTPHLDSLARHGVRFDRAYTAAPQCVPSRATILSGRNVLDIRMSRFSAPLPRDVPTIPEFLDSVGYYTGICGRHYHLDGSAIQALQTREVHQQYDLITFPDRVDYLRTGKDNEVLGQFQTFLDEMPETAPFFMWMNFSDPHRNFTADSYEPDPAKLTVPNSMPDTEAVRKDLAQHYGEIMRLDAHVGQVLNELRQRGLAENTVVIFMGDNGAALLRGKGTLYDIGLHVPLIVAGPTVDSATVSDAMVSGIDVAPTILELAGMPVPNIMSGQSFLPALRGQDYAGHEYIFATRVPHSSGLPKNTAYFDLSRTVFNERYKLMYNALWQLPYSPVDMGGHPMWKDLQSKKQDNQLAPKFVQTLFAQPRSMFELYDLEKDPYEMNNLSGQAAYAETEHQLKATLHEWMIRNQDYLPLPIPPK